MNNFTGKRRGIKQTIYDFVGPLPNTPAAQLIEKAINKCFDYFFKELEEKEDLILTLLEEKKKLQKEIDDLDDEVWDLKNEIKIHR